MFRAGVVLVVQNEEGLVLAFERGDVPGAWQLPQGGIDVGESPEDAAWRELAEETGLTQQCVELVWESTEWIAYEWPESIRAHAKHGDVRRGQIQRWFLFAVRERETCVPIVDDEEFVAWKWVSMESLLEEVAEFRRPSYRRALAEIDRR